MNTTHKHWSKGQIRDFVKQVRASVGTGWEWMVPEVRRALIDAKALSIIAGQDREFVSVEAINELSLNMLVEAGLES